jgi:hypothetical protein
LLVFDTMKVGDDGLSTTEVWYDDSIEEAELGYRKCPRVENVGVTGEGTSDAEEFCVYVDEERSISDSDMLSLFLRSSTNCGSRSGLSFGDIILVLAELRAREVVYCCVWCEDYRELIERWTTWRSVSLRRVEVGMRGTTRSRSYVAELCWNGDFRSRMDHVGWNSLDMSLVVMLRVLFFHTNQYFPRLHPQRGVNP